VALRTHRWNRLPRAALAVALALPGASARAVAAAQPPAARSDEDAALTEARELYTKGKAAYETHQYAAAIELWTEAYANLPASRAGIRNRMVFNIAGAHEKQYAVDGKLAHLRQAVMLLESWVVGFKAMFKATPETIAEVERAQARIEQLEAKIDAIEHGEAAAEPAASRPGEAGKNVGFESDFDSDPQPAPDPRQQAAPDPRRQAAEDQTRDMVVAGWTVGCIGIVVALSGAGALVALDDRPSARVGGAVATGLGLGMVVAGSVLLGVGYTKRRKLAKSDVAVAPMLDRRGGGLALTGRF
jgi:hypothetical protein